MSKTKCPGQDMRFWGPGDIFDVTCSNCGNTFEFFKDDASRICRRCGKRIQNPKLSLGCAQWCEHAKECLGYDPKTQQPEDANEVALVDQLIEAMKKEFGTDQKRITHALTVLEFAQEILRHEPGDPRVVLAAAVLHDIGIQEAERKHGSSAGKYQEIEGPPIAERIMKEIGLDELTIDHVCRIVGNHHSARDIASREFRILWDADWIVNLHDERDRYSEEKLKRIIKKVFKTDTGRKIANKIFLTNEVNLSEIRLN